MAGGRLGSRWLGLPIALAILPCAWSAGAHAASESGNCTAIARIVSIQGTLQVRRAGQTAWSYVRKLDTTLCQGDLLHADAGSRAALLIIPETLVRLDQHSTITISQTADETVVEFTLDTGLPGRIVTAPNACGAGYFITRFPRRFRVLTPFLNASVEGTEFLVAMRCESAQVTVFEGRVRAQQTLVGASQAVTLKDGESFAAGGTEPAAVRVLVKPLDAVQWALYYPPLSEPGPGVGPDQKCQQASADVRGRCLTERAEQRLRAGRVDEAQADVEASLALAPHNADADALYSVISVVKNERQNALALAQRATQVAPLNPRAWIALSYAQQASFKLEDALHSAERAAELNPQSSTAHARAAELLMSLGRIKTAERAARAAVDANPNESRGYTILGFVHLAQINTKEAREDFLTAIERDSSDPLPRLGLGLAIIRDGDLRAGREQIEIAVALDPTNSLIRSYVGKAYYEENTKERDKLAATQFGIAKRLDQKDPTPWFYDAILKQNQNRPTEALQGLLRSIALNDNRAVYRSRLELDEDRATRNVSLALIYQDLGFDQLALTQGGVAATTNPRDAVAHRFLADAYTDVPQQGLARESELLQSQLRQPLTNNPVSPLRTFGSPAGFIPQTGIPRGLGPSVADLNEFNPMFERNNIALYVDGIGGERNTWGDQVVITGIQDQLGFRLGQGHFETDALGPNQAYAQDGYDAFVQVMPNNELSLQGEVQRSEVTRGEVLYPFDPAFTDFARVRDIGTQARLGGKQRLGPASDLIVSGIYQKRTADFSFPLDGSSGTVEQEAGMGEVQYAYSEAYLSLVLGGGHVEASTKVLGTPSTNTSYYSNAYLYGLISPFGSDVQIELGLSGDSISNGDFRRGVGNPKLGMIWTPLSSLRVRAAAFRYLKREQISNETVEPTVVAGFNQIYDDPNGTLAWRYGVGVDAKMGDAVFVGAEVSKRELDVPLLSLGGFEDFAWKEDAARAYLYWTPAKSLGGPFGSSSRLTLSAGYQYQHLSRPEELTGSEGIVSLTTNQVPLGVTLYLGSSGYARVVGTYVRQSGRQQVFFGTDSFAVNQEFWTTDCSFVYNLPQRHGRISIGATNLFNQKSNFVEVDSLAPQFATGRVWFGKASLSF